VINNRYEVIIIGAGPSGLSTALTLFSYGIKNILVVERCKFPRYKCCAGYITEKTKNIYEKFGLDISGCHYSLIKDFKIYYKLKQRLKIENKFLFTNEKIDRVELDNAFYGLAKSNGVEIWENTKIISHRAGKNEITLSNGTTLNYGYLVFADGTTGFGSCYQKSKKRNIAFQMTFPSDRAEEIQIHFGITKGDTAGSARITGLLTWG